MKYKILSLLFVLLSFGAKGQELWQFYPWAPDSLHVIGALPSGEPVWVKLDSLVDVYSPSYYVYVDNKQLSTDANGTVSVYPNKLIPATIPPYTRYVLATDGTGSYQFDTVRLYRLGDTKILRFAIGSAIINNIDIGAIAQDSIYNSGDTIRLRDGLGEVIMSSGGGAGTVKGDGATNTVAYWVSSDSLTNESTFSYLPTNDRMGIGIDVPTGLGAGLHVNGGTFTDIHLTNPTTGTTAGDGTSLFISSSDAYLTNRENGDVVIATQNIDRLRVNETGTVNVSSLDTDGAAPTTSGTTRKVITDANGLLSFKTDTDGTVTSVGLTTGTSGTDVNVSGSPVTSSGTITLNIPTASGSNTGKLSSTDWTTFNNKFNLPSLTSGSVLFSNGTTIAQNNAKFFWNNSTERLGIGTNSPTTPLHVEGRGYFNQGSSNLFLNGGNTTLSGSSNFALGGGTLIALTTGYQNVGIGNGAAPAINTGYANFALGAQSLNACQGCYSNVAIGNQSLFTNISGIRNVAIGQEALAFTTTDASTGVGFYALRAQTTGQYNTGVGYFAAYQNTTGTGNVSAGFFSGPVNGGTNVMLGYYAGSGTTGSGNICIGNFAGGGTLTQDNTLYITNSSATSSGLFGSFANARFGVNQSPSSMARTFDINGELRVRDMVTDNPTFLAAVDNDGDFARVTVSTGLQLVGTTLSTNGVGTVTSISGANGIVTSPNPIVATGTVNLTGQALALHNLATNGIIARTGAGTVAARTIEPNTSGGEFGISVSNGNGVSGNPKISLLSNYAWLQGANNQTLSTTWTKYNFATGNDGDDTGLQYDIFNDEIDIAEQGTYMFSYSLNCKSNTSAVSLNVRMQNVGTGTSLGGQTEHYFNNTNEFCHNNHTSIFSMTAGNSVSLYVRSSSGTPEISGCQVNVIVKRID